MLINNFALKDGPALSDNYVTCISNLNIETFKESSEKSTEHFPIYFNGIKQENVPPLARNYIPYSLRGGHCVPFPSPSRSQARRRRRSYRCKLRVRFLLGGRFVTLGFNVVVWTRFLEMLGAAAPAGTIPDAAFVLAGRVPRELACIEACFGRNF